METSIYFHLFIFLISANIAHYFVEGCQQLYQLKLEKEKIEKLKLELEQIDELLNKQLDVINIFSKKILNNTKNTTILQKYEDVKQYIKLNNLFVQHKKNINVINKDFENLQTKEYLIAVHEVSLRMFDDNKEFIEQYKKQTPDHLHDDVELIALSS